MDLAEAIARSAKNERGELLSGFISKHASGDYNENNYGIGYRHPSGWMGGVYRNSLDKPSAYIAREFQHQINNELAAAAILGGVTGYGKGANLLALPGLVYQLSPERSVAATLVPPVKNQTPATIAVQLRRKF